MNISNGNELLGNMPGVYGVKTGFHKWSKSLFKTVTGYKDTDIACSRRH